MALPPVVPAVNATDKPLEAVSVTELIVGAPGVVNGVPEVASEATPDPAAVTPRIFTLYEVPFVSPLIVKGDVTAAGLLTCQVIPLSVENS